MKKWETKLTIKQNYTLLIWLLNDVKYGLCIAIQFVLNQMTHRVHVWLYKYIVKKMMEFLCLHRNSSDKFSFSSSSFRSSDWNFHDNDLNVWYSCGYFNHFFLFRLTGWCLVVARMLEIETVVIEAYQTTVQQVQAAESWPAHHQEMTSFSAQRSSCRWARISLKALAPSNRCGINWRRRLSWSADTKTMQIFERKCKLKMHWTLSCDKKWRPFWLLQTSNASDNQCENWIDKRRSHAINENRSLWRKTTNLTSWEADIRFLQNRWNVFDKSTGENDWNMFIGDKYFTFNVIISQQNRILRLKWKEFYW